MPTEAKMHPDAAARALIIVGSAGARPALDRLLPCLPQRADLAVVVLLHLPERGMAHWPESLARISALPVAEAGDRQPVSGGRLHAAPPAYHLLVETDGCFSLSLDAREGYVRPAADALLATAADCWGPALCAIIVSGANSDGARGMAQVRARGGRCLAQSVAEAEFPAMPQAAIDAGGIDRATDIEGLKTELAAWWK